MRSALRSVQGVVTYKAVLTVDNSELLLRPGMTATAEIVVGEVENAVLVPNAALRFTPPAGTENESSGLLQRSYPACRGYAGQSSRPCRRRGSIGKFGVLDGGQPVSVTKRVDRRHPHAVVKGELAPGHTVIVDTATSG